MNYPLTGTLLSLALVRDNKYELALAEVATLPTLDLARAGLDYDACSLEQIKVMANEHLSKGSFRTILKARDPWNEFAYRHSDLFKDIFYIEADTRVRGVNITSPITAAAPNIYDLFLPKGTPEREVVEAGLRARYSYRVLQLTEGLRAGYEASPWWKKMWRPFFAKNARQGIEYYQEELGRLYADYEQKVAALPLLK